MRSDLGTAASVGFAMEHWLIPLWLRPVDQGSETREFSRQPVPHVVDHPRLVADRESPQSVPRVPES